MKNKNILLLKISLLVSLFLSTSPPAASAAATNKKLRAKSGYASVNGMKMYHEIEGTGFPLIYIPPGLGHVGMRSFPTLRKTHRVIKVDLQGYGRTADIPERPLSIEQHSKDVIELLKQLEVKKADFLGESYGGAVVTMIAIRNPELVNRVATYGATFGPPKNARNFEMLHSDETPTADSKSFQYQRESYRKVAPHPEYWPKIWEKLMAMKWDGFSDEELKKIKAPFLIALGDRDFVRVDHAVGTLKRISNAELSVIPDAGHFVLFSEPEKVMPVIKHFLEKSLPQKPVATGASGYNPGETR